MTVYVDPLFTMQPRTAQARSHGDRWCHMQVGKDDELEELHQMAEKIGLKRSYFQEHDIYPHYALTPSKRSLAVKHGAIELTDRRRTCCRLPALANWEPGTDR